MRGVFSYASDLNLFLMIFPRISLHCMLVPVQCRKYEYVFCCDSGNDDDDGDDNNDDDDDDNDDLGLSTY